MKIIALERTPKDIFNGYVDDDDRYRSFSASPEEDVYIDTSYKKKDYKNYQHFVNVMGKFDPYTGFLRNPVDIVQLTYEQLLAVWPQVERSYNDPA
jgi:hypothetical protein